MPVLRSGGCLCGAVRYNLASDAEGVYDVICHCENCKKSSGSQFVCSSIWKKKDFRITSGDPKAYSDSATDSATPVIRHFCGDCGSNLFALTALVPDIVSIFSGTFDAEFRNQWKPNKEQYLDTKSPWAPHFDTHPRKDVSERHRRGPLAA